MSCLALSGPTTNCLTLSDPHSKRFKIAGGCAWRIQETKYILPLTLSHGSLSYCARRGPLLPGVASCNPFNHHCGAALPDAVWPTAAKLLPRISMIIEWAATPGKGGSFARDRPDIARPVSSSQFSPLRATRLACSCSVPPKRAQREPQGYAGLTTDQTTSGKPYYNQSPSRAPRAATRGA